MQLAPRTLTDDETQQIGDAIRQTRERRGLTRKELAERVGTTNTNIHRMEGGERGGVSLAMLFLLCEALDCSWREVLGPEPGSDGSHSTDWEAGFRAGIGEAHAMVGRALEQR
jgi:transcriptional regulator with XRE-family HTH domain